MAARLDLKCSARDYSLALATADPEPPVSVLGSSISLPNTVVTGKMFPWPCATLRINMGEPRGPEKQESSWCKMVPRAILVGTVSAKVHPALF